MRACVRAQAERSAAGDGAVVVSLSVDSDCTKSDSVRTRHDVVSRLKKEDI